VSCACANVPNVPTEPLPLTGNELGIDVGLQGFCVTADAQLVEHPRHYRTAQKRLTKAQQRVSRRQKGSKRRAQAVRQCAKQHQHVRRQRGDLHHQTARALVRAYDTLSVEAMPPANLSRRPTPKPDGTGG
jgi:putative transposase